MKIQKRKKNISTGRGRLQYGYRDRGHCSADQPRTIIIITDPSLL